MRQEFIYAIEIINLSITVPPYRRWERGRKNSLRECKTELENMLLKYSDYCIFFSVEMSFTWQWLHNCFSSSSNFDFWQSCLVRKSRSVHKTGDKILVDLVVYKNCGVNGKSTKFGTVIVYDIINNVGYGPHGDLSHNSKYSRFHFLHQDSSMETRLS